MTIKINDTLVEVEIYMITQPPKYGDQVVYVVDYDGHLYEAVVRRHWYKFLRATWTVYEFAQETNYTVDQMLERF